MFICEMLIHANPLVLSQYGVGLLTHVLIFSTKLINKISIRIVSFGYALSPLGKPLLTYVKGEIAVTPAVTAWSLNTGQSIEGGAGLAPQLGIGMIPD